METKPGRGKLGSSGDSSIASRVRVRAGNPVADSRCTKLDDDTMLVWDADLSIEVRFFADARDIDGLCAVGSLVDPSTDGVGLLPLELELKMAWLARMPSSVNSNQQSDDQWVEKHGPTSCRRLPSASVS